MLRFNRNFTADEMDMNLTDKLKGELSGIFTMAVSGLRTLRGRGRFIVPTSSDDAANEYREDSDVIKLFSEEALLPTGEKNKGMRPAALYELYLRWCRSHGVKADNNINLGKRLKRLGFDKTRSNGKDYWCVNMTLAGKEILSKQSALVEVIIPDIAEAANSAGVEETEEKIAA